MENITLVERGNLLVIPQNIRLVFFSIILFITILAMIANALIFKTIFTRKIRCLQKCSIINLGLADITTVVMFAINNLDTLSNELKIWSLGKTMCHLIPMGQTLGTTMSSFTILTIAVDRYWYVNGVSHRKLDPTLWRCLLYHILLWLISAGVSSPMIWLFSYNPIQIVSIEGDHIAFEKAYLCVAVQKNKLFLYYVVLNCLVFMPLVAFFSLSYIKIALLVWRSRKPPTELINQSLPNRKTITCHFKLKVKAFRVVIALLLSFIVCRLPYWVFYIIRLANQYSSSTMWVIHFIFISLSLLNSVVNPLLYNFLNESITFIEILSHFLKKIILFFCCFMNEEFEDMAKYNPFGIKSNNNESNDNLKKNRISFIK